MSLATFFEDYPSPLSRFDAARANDWGGRVEAAVAAAEQLVSKTNRDLVGGYLKAYLPGMPSVPAAHSVYGAGYTSAIATRWAAGQDSAPISDARPVLWVQKHTKASRATNPSEWDQGAIYGALVKEAGDAYGAAVTGYARHESPASGQLIGVHGRAHGYVPAAQVWGGWSYAASMDAATPVHTTIGHEINLNNKAPDQGYAPATGTTRGLVVVTQDGSNPVTIGVDVGHGTGAPNGKMWTGIRLRGGGMMPSGPNTGTGINDGEALRIEGAPTPADGYTGIRFRGGNLRAGITFTETTFSNFAALVLADDQRIVVGPGPASSSYLALNKTTALANLNNLALAVNGTRVVGPRRTGWGVNIGTPTKDPFDVATVTTSGLAQRVLALIDDLKQHGLIGA